MMTYNIHGCVGTDGRRDIERVARVAEEQAPDLFVLQEVDVGRERSGRVDQAEELACLLGMQAHFTCAFESDGGRYGIAMMASHDLDIESEGCLPARGDEVRAAQWARLRLGGIHVDVLHTHLSVRPRDRRAQMAELLTTRWIERRSKYPHLIVCGDLNALPFSSVYRTLNRKFVDVQRATNGRPKATWPSFLPVARVDHIFAGRGFRVLKSSVPKTPLTQVASDHLPLVADLLPLPVAHG
jgi:endonuclease/exonuclease/phosphatase family metal-dependent hydrolase